MRTFLLLPAFNEAEALSKLLPRALEVDSTLHIIVVDDGSEDGTCDVVRSFPTVVLVQHEQNRGLAGALRTLIHTALTIAKPEDVIVMMDSDNTMDPKLISQMRAKLDEGTDIVIASRFAGGSEVGVPLLRKVYSRGARALFQTVARIPKVRDYTCGYRAFRTSILERLKLEKPQLFDSEGFTATAELLLNVAAYNPRICEIPLNLRYDEKIGSSKMNVKRTILEYIRLVIRIKLAKTAWKEGSVTREVNSSPSNISVS